MTLDEDCAYKNVPEDGTSDHDEAQQNGDPTDTKNDGKFVVLEDSRDKMKKNITILRGISIVLNSIIGTGIFVTPNSITKSLNSPAASILVWIAGGVIAVFGGLTMSELAGIMPISGGSVAYLRRIYGPLLTFLNIFVVHFVMIGIQVSILVLTFTKYFWSIFFENPESSVPSYCNGLLGGAMLGILVALTICKPTLAVKTIVLWTVLKVLALAMIIIIGFVYLCKNSDKENMGNIGRGFVGTELDISKWSDAWSGVVWAYYGWDAICAVTSEVKNPQRNIPIIISVSVAIVTILYALTVTSFHIVLPHATLVNPAVHVASEFGTVTIGASGRVILSVAVAISSFGTLSVSLITLSRFIHSGAAEGVLPEVFSLVSVKFRTPVVALIFIGVNTTICAFFGNVESLIGSSTFITFPFFVLCAVGVFVMRRTHPDIHRPFKVPLLFPAVFILFGVYMFVLPFLGAEWLQSLIYVILTVLGIPIYFVCVKDHFNLTKLRGMMKIIRDFVAKILKCD